MLLNPKREVRWQLRSNCIALQSAQSLLDHCCLFIHAGNETWDIWDKERVKSRTDQHPENSEYKLTQQEKLKVAIANCCDSLKGPVQRWQVLI